jgi:hypothetical protein
VTTANISAEGAASSDSRLYMSGSALLDDTTFGVESVQLTDGQMTVSSGDTKGRLALSSSVFTQALGFRKPDQGGREVQRK